jgi:hypothetical protein
VNDIFGWDAHPLGQVDQFLGVGRGHQVSFRSGATFGQLQLRSYARLLPGSGAMRNFRWTLESIGDRVVRGEAPPGRAVPPGRRFSKKAGRLAAIRPPYARRFRRRSMSVNTGGARSSKKCSVRSLVRAARVAARPRGSRWRLVSSRLYARAFP